MWKCWLVVSFLLCNVGSLVSRNSDTAAAKEFYETLRKKTLEEIKGSSRFNIPSPSEPVTKTSHHGQTTKQKVSELKSNVAHKTKKRKSKISKSRRIKDIKRLERSIHPSYDRRGIPWSRAHGVPRLQMFNGRQRVLRPVVRQLQRPMTTTIERRVLRPAIRPPARPARIATIKIRPVARMTVRPALRPALRPGMSTVVKPSVRTTGFMRLPPRPLIRRIVKPAVRPVIRGVIRPVARPVARPVIRGMIRPAGRPVMRGVIRPGGRPVIRGVIRPGGRPVIRGIIRPEVRPFIRGVIRPGRRPAIRGVIRPGRRPVIRGIIRPAGRPVAPRVVRPAMRPAVRMIARPVIRHVVRQPQRFRNPRPNNAQRRYSMPVTSYRPQLYPKQGGLIRRILPISYHKPQIPSPRQLFATFQNQRKYVPIRSPPKIFPYAQQRYNVMRKTPVPLVYPQQRYIVPLKFDPYMIQRKASIKNAILWRNYLKSVHNPYATQIASKISLYGNRRNLHTANPLLRPAVPRPQVPYARWYRQWPAWTRNGLRRQMTYNTQYSVSGTSTNSGTNSNTVLKGPGQTQTNNHVKVTQSTGVRSNLNRAPNPWQRYYGFLRRRQLQSSARANAKAKAKASTGTGAMSGSGAVSRPMGTASRTSPPSGGGSGGYGYGAGYGWGSSGGGGFGYGGGGSNGFPGLPPFGGFPFGFGGFPYMSGSGATNGAQAPQSAPQGGAPQSKFNNKNKKKKLLNTNKVKPIRKLSKAYRRPIKSSGNKLRRPALPINKIAHPVRNFQNMPGKAAFNIKYYTTGPQRRMPSARSPVADKIISNAISDVIKGVL